MPVSLTSLLKPEYVMRPSQAWRRALQLAGANSEAFKIVELPWGTQLRVNAQEQIGRAVVSLGVYDLVVSEMLWRLCSPGDTTMDIGANIGHMTSVLAKRSGPTGKVIACEAHPEIFGELQNNIRRWPSQSHAEVVALNIAVSDAEGTVVLEMPTDFAGNCGLAHVSTVAGADGLQVPAQRLDSLVAPHESIAVAKLDVEGHERAVLDGAVEILARRRVRDWIFEEHRPFPTPVTQAFENAGYRIFEIEKRLSGPRLCPVGEARKIAWEASNYLATADPERVHRIMAVGGWHCLRRIGA